MWSKVSSDEWELYVEFCPEMYRVYVCRATFGGNTSEYRFRFVAPGKLFTSSKSWKTLKTAKKRALELVEDVKGLYG